MVGAGEAKTISLGKGVRSMNPGSQSVLYCYTLDQSIQHEGKSKLGMASLRSGFDTAEEVIERSYALETRNGVTLYGSEEIEAAAHARIKEQTGATHAAYTLHWAVLAVRQTRNKSVVSSYEYINDHAPHDVLVRSGIAKVRFTQGGKPSEWFETTPDTALDAVIASMNSEHYLKSSSCSTDVPFVFSPRPEQQQFIDDTWKRFENATLLSPAVYYWNAIMRFGKTFTAYGMVKQKEIESVLVISHRGVNSGWYKDFQRILEPLGYQYASKSLGADLSTLDGSTEKVVAYASLQDLRGSFDIDLEELADMDTLPDGALKKNHAVFSKQWGLIIIDEAHEGTLTVLAQLVKKHLKTSRELFLSGTPYNLSDDFDDNVSNWGLIEEQEAKANWDKNNDGANPYSDTVNISLNTINITSVLDKHTLNEVTATIDGKEFKFSELFKVKETADKESRLRKKKSGKPEKYHGFVHQGAVIAFLDKLAGTDLENTKKFPYGSPDMEKVFAHVMWALPGVKAAAALEELMSVHKYFRQYHLVNVTGNETDSENAIADVKSAIASSAKDGRLGTITLTCGRLTVGSTVPEWTAVFMMNDTSSAISYMQTIFRAKTPGILPNGQRKSVMYAFDFKPERSLQVISEMASAAAKQRRSRVQSEGGDQEQVSSTRQTEEVLSELLKWMPCISMDDAEFREISAKDVMRTINEVFVSKIVSSGFDSKELFDKSKMDTITADMAELANRLSSALKENSGTPKVSVNETKATPEQRELAEKGKPKRSEHKTDEDLTAAQEEYKEAQKAVAEDRKNRDNMLVLLRSVAAKIPLMVLAHPVKERIYLDTFATSIDDASWREFMPSDIKRTGEGISWDTIKGFFSELHFDMAVEQFREDLEEIFAKPQGVWQDELADTFSRFANPDKETVLTPNPVVNRHLSETLGGVRRVDDDGERIENPEYTNPFRGVEGKEDIEKQLDDFWTSTESTVLEINGKTSLYPLYMATTMRDKQMEGISESHPHRERFAEQTWKHVIENQIYVNVRTEYAASIARRVLAGDNDDIVVNVSVVDIANISKHTRGIIKGDIDGISAGLLTEKVWRFIFDTTDFANAGERAQQVLEAKNATEVKILVDHVEAGDGVSAAFNAVVGNPPYQTGMAGKANDAVYHFFMEASQCLAQKVSLIYPARWLTGARGTGIEGFRERELNSKKYVKFVLNPSQNFFDNVLTEGGICYFLWDRDSVEKTTYHYGDTVEERDSLVDGKPTFIRDSKFNEVVEKVSSKKFLTPTGALHYGANVSSDYKIYEYASQVTSDDPTVKIFFSGRGGGVKRETIPKSVSKNPTDGFKVFTIIASHPKGDSLRRPGRVFAGESDEICSSSFIAFNHLRSKEEANRLVRYLKTDFSTFLLGVVCPTQHAYAKVYKLIPDVDFATGEIKDKPGVFLDFSGNSDDLDDQLARIYGLTDEERELMRTSIKPWKDKNSLTADGLY